MPKRSTAVGSGPLIISVRFLTSSSDTAATTVPPNQTRTNAYIIAVHRMYPQQDERFDHHLNQFFGSSSSSAHPAAVNYVVAFNVYELRPAWPRSTSSAILQWLMRARVSCCFLMVSKRKTKGDMIVVHDSCFCILYFYCCENRRTSLRRTVCTRFRSQADLVSQHQQYSSSNLLARGSFLSRLAVERVYGGEYIHIR